MEHAVSFVDALKKLPMETYGAAKSEAKSAVKKTKSRIGKVRRDIRNADRGIFGGKGLRSNLRELRKGIKEGQRKQ